MVVTAVGWLQLHKANNSQFLFIRKHKIVKYEWAEENVSKDGKIYRYQNNFPRFWIQVLLNNDSSQLYTLVPTLKCQRFLPGVLNEFMPTLCWSFDAICTSSFLEHLKSPIRGNSIYKRSALTFVSRPSNFLFLFSPHIHWQLSNAVVIQLITWSPHLRNAIDSC